MKTNLAPDFFEPWSLPKLMAFFDWLADDAIWELWTQGNVAFICPWEIPHTKAAPDYGALENAA